VVTDGWHNAGGLAHFRGNGFGAGVGGGRCVAAAPRPAAAVQNTYQAEIEAAKETARQKAQDKLGEALGVQPGEGQDLKEAVKDKVEQELLKGLGRLLKP